MTVTQVDAALAAMEEARHLNAFTSERADEARREAVDLERATARGLLHGVPVVVKDLFDVAGLPTTGGCAAYGDRVARADAAAVARLRAAGAVVVAKTNQHELGAGATGLVSCFGPALHPLDAARVTGGSSSGSAVAVAAGVVPIALGSDTGGSVRIPASFCGITALRPTPGLVSLEGAQPMSPGYDTAGPMAATARDCALALAALRGERAAPVLDPTVVAGLRVGLPRPYFGPVHPETGRAVLDAATRLEALGACVEWTDGPRVDDGFDGFRHVWADVAHHHRALWDDPRVSDEVAHLIDLGRRTTGVEYAASRARAAEVEGEFRSVLERVDVLLTPCTPYPAPRVTDEDAAVRGGTLDVHRGGPSLFTIPVNEAGLPAVAFPVGTSVDGLPLGAQLIGRRYDDERLLAVVTALQDEVA